MTHSNSENKSQSGDKLLHTAKYMRREQHEASKECIVNARRKHVASLTAVSCTLAIVC